MDIPEELISLAAQRRLIPFVGAGFSSSLGLPSWENMLRDVSRRIEDDLPFEQLLEATNKDLLQVAEYLYLKHDRQIGPIRHQIEKSFATGNVRPLESGPHVELVNLGANQIYTTNYDDIIEQTYRALDLPVSPVILPKDVALADTERTQVVKYHGDLAHERTLVLTESAYYKRLDFESPMDLKFRSDLLGKSVLFMGYSFRDINIRIIWFKLMEMMRDIPEADRRPSYIVRIDPNPALEDLYTAVGLKTIVLNREGEVTDNTERTKLLGKFLLQLSARAETHPLPHNATRKEVFVSKAAIEFANERIEVLESHPMSFSRSLRFGGLISVDSPSISRLLNGIVPPPLQSTWNECVSGLLPYCGVDKNVLPILARLSPSRALTSYVVQVLQTPASEEIREAKQQLLEVDTLWPKVWDNEIDSDLASEVLMNFLNEISYQSDDGADEDIAYLADLVKRIEVGILSVGEGKVDLKERATELLKFATQIYPSIAKLAPEPSSPPQVEEILVEVAVRADNFEAVDLDLGTVRATRRRSTRAGLASEPRLL